MFCFFWTYSNFSHHIHFYEMILSPPDPFSVRSRANSWLAEGWLGFVASQWGDKHCCSVLWPWQEEPEPSLWNQTPRRDLSLFRRLKLCGFGYIPGPNLQSSPTFQWKLGNSAAKLSVLSAVSWQPLTSTLKSRKHSLGFCQFKYLKAFEEKEKSP